MASAARPAVLRGVLVLALLAPAVAATGALADGGLPGTLGTGTAVAPQVVELVPAPAAPGQASTSAPAPVAAAAPPASPAPAAATTTLADLRRVVGADQLAATGRGVDVAIIDSGVTPVPGLDAPGQLVHGPDLSFDADDPAERDLDGLGHGTHMAGVIAGVAPDSRLVSLKVGARDGAVDVTQVIAAVDWVVEHRQADDLDIRVLNLSLGFDTPQPALVDPLAYAVDRAQQAGIVVVVAGGNDGKGDRRLSSPASNPNVLAVGAADTHGSTDRARATVADFSAWGNGARRPDVVAPGARIASLRAPGSTLDTSFPAARVGEGHFRGSGTSQAAAAVSGLAALLLEQRPELTPAEVKKLLRRSADPLPGSSRVGGAGLVDVAAAADLRTPRSTPKPVALLGTGSVDLTRGTTGVSKDGTPLVGEVDVTGAPFDPAAWKAAQLAGRTWTGGEFVGRTWTGGSWAGRTWTGGSWAGGSWAGGSWAGGSWAGGSWAGGSWAGGSWAGGSWAGRTWTGGSWAGGSWAGGSWAGGSWAGGSWAGGSWAGGAWYGTSWG